MISLRDMIGSSLQDVRSFGASIEELNTRNVEFDLVGQCIQQGSLPTNNRPHDEQELTRLYMSRDITKDGLCWLWRYFNITIDIS